MVSIHSRRKVTKTLLGTNPRDTEPTPERHEAILTAQPQDLSNS